MSYIKSEPFYISRDLSGEYNFHGTETDPDMCEYDFYYVGGEITLCETMFHELTDIEIEPGEYVKAWLVVEES